MTFTDGYCKGYYIYRLATNPNTVLPRKNEAILNLKILQYIKMFYTN